MSTCPPSPADRWLRVAFADRSWLFAILREAIDRSVPVEVPTPSAQGFGRTVEAAVLLDQCTALPFVGCLQVMPRRTAREMARLAGFGPPPGMPSASWPTWIRRDDQPVLRHRLHHAASRLSYYHEIIGDLRSRDDIAAARRLLANAYRHGYHLSYAAAEAPAFLAVITSYDRDVRHVLRGLGSAVAAPVLPGGRTADLAVGTTIVEIKAGWLASAGELNHLVDQMLGYGLLSQLAPCPATHVAAYFARYGIVRRFAVSAMIARCAVEPIDIADAARTYLGYCGIR